MKITFLGVPETPTQVGALRYAVERRIPLTLHAFVYGAGGGGSLQWTIEGPIHIEEQPGGPDATLRHYTQLVNDFFSAQILKHPEQYAWGHRRFPRHHYEGKRAPAARR